MSEIKTMRLSPPKPRGSSRGEDLTGKLFGRLTAISLVEPTVKTRRWNCVCECGKLTVVVARNLISGNTKSCGCLNRDVHTSHGLAGTNTHKAWQNMWQRTTNEKIAGYAAYKYRLPPESWRQFKNFLADMGECPEGLTLDRKDNSKPYSKDNCHWISKAKQQDNKPSSWRVMHLGRLHSIRELSQLSGIPYFTLAGRLSRNWTVEDALTLPHRAKAQKLLPTSALVKLYPTT